MMNYKISVIVPLFNVAPYIKTCISSVLNQMTNFPIEIIMVNDGSKDESLTIANDLASNNHHIKVISQMNKGLGGARNTGLLNATGEYVLFLDADDRLVENSLSRLITIADQHQLDVLEFSAKGVNAEGKTVYHNSNKTNSPMNGRAYYHAIRYMNSACNKLYNLNFLKRHQLLFKERIFIEDFEFNTRVFAKAESVFATDILGALFLQTFQSITRNNDALKIKKMQNDIVEVIRLTSDLKNKYEGKEYTAFFNERLSFLTSTLFFQMFKRKAKYDEVIEMKNELVSKKIFYGDYSIYEKKKELFRIVVLRNLYIYPLLLRLLR